MTGIADLYLLARNPNSKEAWARLSALLKLKKTRYDCTRFVVLSWKRTGSNLLCGILFNHPEIVMHNELFNPIDIFTYYQRILWRNEDGDRWNTLGRDLYPEAFLEHLWTGKDVSGCPIKEGTKSIGFKSFPDHWWEPQNDEIFQEKIIDDPALKKVILYREDELAVYISMKRAERTGYYMTLSYPKDLKIQVEPAAFQIFVNNYRDTFRRRYKSPLERNMFRISYEQLVKEETFEKDILPLLWDFLGVDNRQPLRKLRETVKQATPDEDLSMVIENWAELEFCFRHTDVNAFPARRNPAMFCNKLAGTNDEREAGPGFRNSWSILLPICSRTKRTTATAVMSDKANSEMANQFNSNRLNDLAVSSQYNATSEEDSGNSVRCWENLSAFAESLKKTSSPETLARTECLVGIDVDDNVFHGEASRSRIREMIPCSVRFFDIQQRMYGKVCKIWNYLGMQAQNDFVILLGDDIVLKDECWQSKVFAKFHDIARRTKLPFGAACVALNDESFPGFPTFPVVHRWHIRAFGSLLPRQFVNQGGDPYLFELYSRFNAAAFVTDCRLENTIGGDGEARYKKYEISWSGQILRLNLMHMRRDYLKAPETGVCLDIVVPSYRTNNTEILEAILRLKCSVPVYTKFWIVVDNPNETHVRDVKGLAERVNAERFVVEGNYHVTVLHYGDNKGASFARNLGYNYSTADWTLFLDDDVRPDDHLLDAYVGAIRRYPNAKVFVGNTELPLATNTWTKMLRSCNIMFFYGISKHLTFPPWGVTANLMVRGSRHNGTIQFKGAYPKTGGGEDIDLCFQFKRWYRRQKIEGVIVGVEGATAQHPWWKGGDVCYDQINGWAWGDSLCITQWPEKCFWCFPNWIEFIC
ncbi:3-beta hydroxysteroid dehydrogenase/isomerase family [Seminavis robusta]|uniref:3-beta hydroxysteroid dehydrogenase/isomerase family n=1 Tax=Seminavis robusta TaxID=568900 RepID=A0A9N8E7M2_9STRA|nr:3-beta hydroxysteroid dehydrogenase/isomerase family [Seminavis robusta]|eukprot:Sro599_g173210.1 3-beta hydroxysteroid dehydrogenase/isomerase family (870) ;mRNA; r:17906-20515